MSLPKDLSPIYFVRVIRMINKVRKKKILNKNFQINFANKKDKILQRMVNKEKIQ